MKLNIYIQKLLRAIICKVGRQQTSKLLKTSRTTVYVWENNNKWNRVKNIKNLPLVCKTYCNLHPKENLKEVLMQGLVFYMEDVMKEIA
jgi:hypothetical protein